MLCLQDMGRLEGRWIAAAAIPAVLITILFFFDHNVSSQLAQQPEFGLRKPPAYHYDFFLLGGLDRWMVWSTGQQGWMHCNCGFGMSHGRQPRTTSGRPVAGCESGAGLMTLLCGLLGLPPVNGVLPQAPMHTRALARVAGRNKLQHKQQVEQEQQSERSNGQSAKGARTSQARLKIHGSPSAQALLSAAAADSSMSLERASGGGVQPATGPAPAAAVASCLRAALPALDPAAAAFPAAGSALSSLHTPVATPAASECMAEGGPSDSVVAMHVLEQRLSGLLQSLGVGVCLAAMPAIRQMPTAALWGYFAFMALESLPGSQLWDRTLLLLTDPARRPQLLERGHAPYLETVPFRQAELLSFLRTEAGRASWVQDAAWVGVGLCVRSVCACGWQGLPASWPLLPAV